MQDTTTKKGYNMIQGSNMTIGHKGMRKGISLVEMLVAIVLFGIIGTISYTYYKNYYDTSFAAKQLRIYTVVDQAAQLGNAFDLYNTKNGVDANETQQFVDDKILTQIPVKQPFVTTSGWDLVEGFEVITGNTSGVVFTYPVDGNVSNADKLDYCNILNNVADKDYNLSRVDGDLNSTANLYDLGINSNTSEMEYFHCSDINITGPASQYQFVFVKRERTD